MAGLEEVKLVQLMTRGGFKTVAGLARSRMRLEKSRIFANPATPYSGFESASNRLWAAF